MTRGIFLIISVVCVLFFEMKANAHPISIMTRPLSLLSPECQGRFLKMRVQLEFHEDPGVMLTPDLNTQPPDLQPVISPLVQVAADFNVQAGISPRFDLVLSGPLVQHVSPDAYAVDLKWKAYGGDEPLAVVVGAGWGFTTSFGESAAVIAPYNLNFSQEEAGIIGGERINSDLLVIWNLWLRRLRANGPLHQLQPSDQVYILDGSGSQEGAGLGIEYDWNIAGVDFYGVLEGEFVVTSWTGSVGSAAAGAGAFSFAIGGIIQ